MSRHRRLEISLRHHKAADLESARQSHSAIDCSAQRDSRINRHRERKRRSLEERARFEKYVEHAEMMERGVGRREGGANPGDDRRRPTTAAAATAVFIAVSAHRLPPRLRPRRFPALVLSSQSREHGDDDRDGAGREASGAGASYFAAFASTLAASPHTTATDTKSRYAQQLKAASASQQQDEAPQRINLADFAMGDHQAAKLIERIRTTGGKDDVRRLNLSRCGLGSKSALALASRFAEGGGLGFGIVTLDLSSNRLGDRGAALLARGLVASLSVVRLNVARNNIGPDGARVIAEALGGGGNAKLRELCVRWNQVGARGMHAFAEALHVDRGCFLADLDLGWCAMRGEDAQHQPESRAEYAALEALGVSLIKNRSLTHLDLGWNRLGRAAMARFAELLNENHTVLGLHVEGNSGATIDPRGFVHVPERAERVHGEAEWPLIKLHWEDDWMNRGTEGDGVGTKSSAPEHDQYTPANCWVCGGWSELKVCYRGCGRGHVGPMDDKEEEDDEYGYLRGDTASRAV